MSQEKDLQRVELRLNKKVVELLEKKAEIEGVKRAEYIRRLIIKDIKSLIADKEEKKDDSKLDSRLKSLLEYVELMQELRKATNKLGAILNQSIRYKMFGLKEENYSDLEQEFNRLYVRVTEILYYLKNNL
jgi:ribbon-helix-helix protein, copG family